MNAQSTSDVAQIFPLGDQLTTAVTVEGLLFTALGVLMAFAPGSSRGLDLPLGVSPHRFAQLLSTCILVAGVGASCTWWLIYHDRFPTGIALGTPIAIAFAIVLQPIAAFFLAAALREDDGQ